MKESLVLAASSSTGLVNCTRTTAIDLLRETCPVFVGSSTAATSGKRRAWAVIAAIAVWPFVSVTVRPAGAAMTMLPLPPEAPGNWVVRESRAR